MRIKIAPLFLAILSLAIAHVAVFEVQAQQQGLRDVKPQRVTLLSQLKHQDFEKAIVNLKLGVRGDSLPQQMKYVYDLRYGGHGSTDNYDMFDIPIGRGSRSKIIDAGELDWTEIDAVPVLNASHAPHSQMRAEYFLNGKVIHSTPESTLAKVIPGHIYLLRTKDKERDLYVALRVEELKPGDEVTISWKLVPLPEDK